MNKANVFKKALMKGTSVKVKNKKKSEVFGL